MKKINFIAILSLALILNSCCAKKKTVATANEVQGKKELNIMMDSKDYIYWAKVAENNIGTPTRQEVKLPKKYVAFQIDQNKLEEYFVMLKKGAKNIINIPLLGTMNYYSLSEANTMAPELAAKYPEIQSLRGVNIADKNDKIFVDIDGKKLRVKIEKIDANYIVEPYETDKGLYYLIYNLLDTGYPKSKFE